MKNSKNEQGSKGKKEIKKEKFEEKEMSATANILNNNSWDQPPFERPNCIPGYGPYSIEQFKDDDDDDDNDNDRYDEYEDEYELSTPSSLIHSFDEDEEDMFNTKKSNTPSSSGDSGYGTTRRKSNNSNNNKKVQDLFEALFAPVAVHNATTTTTTITQSPPSLKIQPSNNNNNNNNTVSHSGVNSKLSLLFSKKPDPHYVKYQTWSNNQQQQLQQQKSSAVITNLSTPLKKGVSMRRPHEENLFKSSLPPVIKVEKEIPVAAVDPLVRKQTRTRRRTDASILQPTIILPITTTTNNNNNNHNISTIIQSPKLDPKHARRKSFGSALDMKTSSLTSPIDTSNILDHYNDKGTLLARYVSIFF